MSSLQAGPRAESGDGESYCTGLSLWNSYSPSG